MVLNSVEGFGTNAVVFLKTLSTDANELLPIYNKTSYKHYKCVLLTADLRPIAMKLTDRVKMIFRLIKNMYEYTYTCSDKR